MAKAAKYYNVDDFNKYRKTQGKCSPPFANVLAAAQHIQTLFNAKKFTWGFMGKWAMLCLGYKREIHDLHIAYDVKDFERLKSKLEADPRVRLPMGMNSLLPFKILVWTGFEYKDQQCTASASIELNLVPSGSCGTPMAGLLGENLVVRGLKPGEGYKCLNLLYLVKTMLSYSKARDLMWDPRKDILYLCKAQGVEVQRICAHLDRKETQQVLSTPFFAKLHIEDQRCCWRLLLDKDPPPTMTLTPPAPQTSRPMQTVTSRSTEQDRGVGTSDSRPRNSKGQRSSSCDTTDHRLTKDLQPPSTDLLQDPRQLSHIAYLQSVNTRKPQKISAAKAIKQARNSMPNLLAVAPELQTNPDSNKTTARNQEQSPLPHKLPAAGQPTLLNQPHQHTNSQLAYGSHFQPAYIQGTQNLHKKKDSLHSQTSVSSCTTSEGTGISAQGIQSQRGSIHMASTEKDGTPSQQDSQDEESNRRRELHIVGPKGIYAAPPPPRPQHQRHASAPPLPTDAALVFELDAAVHENPTFLAELPGESIAAAQEEQESTITHDFSLQHLTPRPLNPRTTSAPCIANTLPASLLVGGGRGGKGSPDTTPHNRDHVPSHLDISTEHPRAFSPSQTNAYRYSFYATPQPPHTPSTKPSQKSADAGAVGAYVAYRPTPSLKVVQAQVQQQGYVVEEEDSQRMPVTTAAVGGGHKRNVSNQSSTSQDSMELAREYRELLGLEEKKEGGYLSA